MRVETMTLCFYYNLVVRQSTYFCCLNSML